jgi:hypothetical protein
VTARFAGDSPNGPIVNLFASIFGFDTTDVSATATAAFDDRFAKYTQPTGGPLLPFTIHEDIYNDQLVNGSDDFSYDEVLDVVQTFSDGITEVRLFPHAAEDPPAGAGNFGRLDIGMADFITQIESGVSPEDIQLEVGTTELTFIDAAGDPTTYEITGDTGMVVSLETSLQTRIGDVVGFFVHSMVAGSGSNTTYTITKVAFGRVVEANLSDPVNPQLLLQPAVYSGFGVGTDPNAPDTKGMVGRIALVK